jgi:hypothetical protein
MEKLECMCLVDDTNMGNFTSKYICSERHYCHVYCLQVYLESVLYDVQDVNMDNKNKLLKCPYGGKDHSIIVNNITSILTEISRDDLESSIISYLASD